MPPGRVGNPAKKHATVTIQSLLAQPGTKPQQGCWRGRVKKRLCMATHQELTVFLFFTMQIQNYSRPLISLISYFQDSNRTGLVPPNTLFSPMQFLCKEAFFISTPFSTANQGPDPASYSGGGVRRGSRVQLAGLGPVTWRQFPKAPSQPCQARCLCPPR